MYVSTGAATFDLLLFLSLCLVVDTALFLLASVVIVVIVVKEVATSIVLVVVIEAEESGRPPLRTSDDFLLAGAKIGVGGGVGSFERRTL